MGEMLIKGLYRILYVWDIATGYKLEGGCCSLFWLTYFSSLVMEENSRHMNCNGTEDL